MAQTYRNVDHVRQQLISQNQGRRPFAPSDLAITRVITDQDTFPYPRFFRGIAASAKPVIFEREAGWRPREDSCYNPTFEFQIERPNYCWQIPCSTTLPCNQIEVAAQNDGCVIISP